MRQVLSRHLILSTRLTRTVERLLEIRRLHTWCTVTHAGVAFWIGVSFDNGWIFPDLLVGTWGTLLGNGLTTGCLAAIVMTLVLGITSRRGGRLSVECDASAFPKVDTLLNEFASKAGWNEASANRLRSAGEEALSSLLSQDDIQGIESRKRLAVSVRGADGSIELEFMVTSQDAENLEDRLAYLSDQSEIWDDREISFRLLRHYASSVRHRNYHDIDIVTVQVEGSSWPKFSGVRIPAAVIRMEFYASSIVAEWQGTTRWSTFLLLPETGCDGSVSN